MKFYPVGAAALLVELDDLAAALALRAEIERRRADGWAPSLTDVIPAARTILLDGVTDREAVERELRGWDVRSAAAPDGPVVEIPCRYDGEDLAAVAASWRVSEGEAARVHAGTEFRVAFCGFAPGFAYLTGLSEELAVPRRLPRGPPCPRAAWRWPAPTPAFIPARRRAGGRSSAAPTRCCGTLAGIRLPC